MKKIHKIFTINAIPIVEINLTEAMQNRDITLEDIAKALELLYDNKINALKLHDMAIQPLQENIIRDYILSFSINDKSYYAYNFACCFIDSRDADTLFGQNEE